jgi:hypothetical protein
MAKETFLGKSIKSGSDQRGQHNGRIYVYCIKRLIFFCIIQGRLDELHAIAEWFF